MIQIDSASPVQCDGNKEKIMLVKISFIIIIFFFNNFLFPLLLAQNFLHYN